MRSTVVSRGGVACALLLGMATACDTTEPRIPATLQIAGGDAQTGTVGAAVPVAPTVRVLTADGKSVANEPVTFTVSGGGGSLASLGATTDRTGTATIAGWTLGTVAGENTLTVSSGLLPTVTIRATAAADVPAGLLLVREPAVATASGQPLATQPVVQLVDRFGNAAAQAGITVVVSVIEAGATVVNAAAVTGADGRATFVNLALSGPAGPYTLEFQSSGLIPRRAAGPIVLGIGICGDAGAHGLTLDFALGQMVRLDAAAATAPTCLAFELSRASGQQYLLLFENMPFNGVYAEGVFDQEPRSGSQFGFAVRGVPISSSITTTPAFRQLSFPRLDDALPAHAWDFGDGPILEGEIRPFPPGETEPQLLRNGVAVSLISAQADPQVGDTVSVLLEGISRLSIPRAQQNVVIRYISDELIFAEDTRLDSLAREDSAATGGPAYNSPMTLADMEGIAQEYASYARVQGDLLFAGQHNSSVSSRSPDQRVLAVHTLMYANNIWGYTYSSTHYFAYDFWVGQTKGTNRLTAQHPQRVADALFMHEIAHMRHYGLLELAGRTGQRGNQWLVEGFARFSERLPIAHRLLGTASPSRTANVVLPRNAAFPNAYYLDDVPTYLQAGTSMFGGYGSSSFVFDYFADQVALRGGEPLAALRDFVINAGTPGPLDAAVARWLPGTGSFGELFTRSRIALYTDDDSLVSPPPAWTQYLQYQLRASRPPGTQAPNDPRNAWLKVTPGQPFATDLVNLPAGAARGVLIDGTAAAASARITIEATPVANGVVSITRIR